MKEDESESESKDLEVYDSDSERYQASISVLRCTACIKNACNLLLSVFRGSLWYSSLSPRKDEDAAAEDAGRQ